MVDYISAYKMGNHKSYQGPYTNFINHKKELAVQVLNNKKLRED